MRPSGNAALVTGGGSGTVDDAGTTEAVGLLDAALAGMSG